MTCALVSVRQNRITHNRDLAVDAIAASLLLKLNDVRTGTLPINTTMNGYELESCMTIEVFNEVLLRRRFRTIHFVVHLCSLSVESSISSRSEVGKGQSTGLCEGVLFS
mmetsp:Transcript_20788/g.46405  ORF Transcript_20788/g.46405 Transcript_20788/m.46405 type:complete len:109 (-) Transcript_20788:1818-2144(-)